MSTFFPRLKRMPATREQAGTTTIDTADIDGGTLTRTITNSGTPEVADTTIRYNSTVPAIDKYDVDRTYTGEWSTSFGGKVHRFQNNLDTTPNDWTPAQHQYNYKTYSPLEWPDYNLDTSDNPQTRNWKLLNWQLDRKLVNPQQINQ